MNKMPPGKLKSKRPKKVPLPRTIENSPERKRLNLSAQPPPVATSTLNDSILTNKTNKRSRMQFISNSNMHSKYMMSTNSHYQSLPQLAPVNA